MMIYLEAWGSHEMNLLMVACVAALLWLKTASYFRHKWRRRLMTIGLVLLTTAQGIFMVHNMYIAKVAALDYQQKEVEANSAYSREYMSMWNRVRRTAAEQLVDQCVRIVNTNQMMRSHWNLGKEEVSLKEFMVGAVEFYYFSNEDLIDDPEFQKVRQQQSEERSETIMSPYGDCFDLPLGYYACGGFWAWMNWLEHNAYQISLFVLGLVCLRYLKRKGSGNAKAGR